eukprot:6473950-Amphidinium_carterae.2
MVATCKSLVADALDQPSVGQNALREEYAKVGIQTSADKTVTGSLHMQSLGAAVDGEVGTVGTPLSRRQVVFYQFLELIASSEVQPDTLLTLVGKLIHMFEFRRQCLSALDVTFAYVRELQERPRVSALPLVVGDELLVAACLLPFARANLRADFCSTVTCSDASPFGGGSALSVGLTPLGRSLLCQLEETPLTQVEPVLVFGFADHLGALRRACDLLEIRPVAYIGIASSKVPRRVVREAWPSVVQLASLDLLTHAQLADWRRHFKQVRSVLLGFAVDPAVAEVEVSPTGVEGLPFSVVEPTVQLFRQFSWTVAGFCWGPCSETSPWRHLAASLSGHLVDVEAASCGWVRQDCRMVSFGGFDTPPCFQSFISSSPVPRVGTVEPLPPFETLLTAGCARCVPDAGAFPRFLTPVPLRQAPPLPGQVRHASDRAMNAWKGDSFRWPPHYYELDWMIRQGSELRPLSPDEQLLLLGFNSGHLDILAKLVPRKLLRDLKRRMIAHTPAVPVLAGFLHQALGKGFAQNFFQRLWRLAVSLRPLPLSSSWSHRFGQGAAPDATADESKRFIMLTARGASHRGGEVRLETGELFLPPKSPWAASWASFNSAAFQWRVLQSYPWQEGARHINYLELLAVLNLLRRLASDPHRHASRFLHLCDNQATLGALCKGRSSAHLLNFLLRRIAA